LTVREQPALADQVPNRLTCFDGCFRYFGRRRIPNIRAQGGCERGASIEQLAAAVLVGAGLGDAALE